MKRKLLITTLLSMSLLSLNLAAAGKMKCSDGYCMVDLSNLSSKSKKVESKKVSVTKEGYRTVVIDNIETIVFADSKYVMTQDEIAEYDLIEMQKNLLIPVLSSESLPTSDYLCEDNLKAVEVAGLANTFECA